MFKIIILIIIIIFLPLFLPLILFLFTKDEKEELQCKLLEEERIEEMNKRQAKKQYKKFIYGNQRYGCEYCDGLSNRLFKNDDGWLNISLGINKKEKKIIINQNHIPIGYIETKYCWNCGRKLK